LRKRLSIDQLRVAVSRPWERLVWLDINPSDEVVAASLAFLNGDGLGGTVSSSVPAAITKTLQEEELDAEERVQRCQADARQYLEGKPEMAWSRAQQAATLLGRLDTPGAVTDQAVRDAVHLTLAEICFLLGVRHTRLPAELGNPDLFAEAAQAALQARREGLAAVIRSIGRVHRAPSADRLQALADFAYVLPRHKSELESWVLVEIAAERQSWIEALEAASPVNRSNTEAFLQLFPAFYDALGVPDAAQRLEGLRQRAIQALIKEKYFDEALRVLAKLTRREPKLEALCNEGLGNLRGAAESFKQAGDLKNALRCYRAIPDFAAALEIARGLPNHPAAPSLEWLARLQSVVGERPEKFTRTVTDAEKKILEEMLEQALGVKRRRPAPKPARRSRAKAERPP
jgi:tetratricopeptide (TPR) repeat protein